MAKYAPLAAHLRQEKAPMVAMTFEEVEEVLGGPLPPSAREHEAWWRDESAGSAHVQATTGWLAAGFRVASVDLRSGRVTFERRR